MRKLPIGILLCILVGSCGFRSEKTVVERPAPAPAPAPVVVERPAAPAAVVTQPPATVYVPAR